MDSKQVAAREAQEDIRNMMIQGMAQELRVVQKKIEMSLKELGQMERGKDVPMTALADLVNRHLKDGKYYSESTEYFFA